jgi:hypothetical protein
VSIINIILLVGFIILLVTFPVVYYVKRQFLKKVWMWPEGTRIPGRYGKFTVHFVYSNVALEFGPAETARRAALAAHCLNTVIGNDVVKTEFTVHLLNDRTYRTTYDAKYGITSNGMLQKVYRKAGDESMPLVACREGAFGSTPKTGSLVIHELLHDVIRRTPFVDPGDPLDHDHSDKRFWSGERPDSIEKKAQSLFVNLVAESKMA